MPEVGESREITPARRTGQPRKPVEGRWWSVDPGQVHVGIAIWDGDHLFTAMEVSPGQLLQMIMTMEPPLIVIEAFTLRSPKWTNAQAEQASDTLKLIGAVEYAVDCYSGGVVEQQPSVRHVAQASPYWRRLQQTSVVPANSHARSAVAHGLYYLHFAKR